MSFLRLTSCAGRSALLIGGLLLHSAGMSLNAQIQRTPGALSMGSSLGFGAAFPVVKNEPYTANVVMQDTDIGPDGKKTIHEALNINVRDSAGRLRDEQLDPSRWNRQFHKGAVAHHRSGFDGRH